MWPHGVVVTPPSLDHDLGLFERVEDFSIEQFVTQLSVEGFNVTVLSRAAGLDVNGLCADSSDPFTKCLSDELRSDELRSVVGNVCELESHEG